MEVELRMETKKRADDEAIRVFAENLRQLLLAPPLGRKNVLAIDPGFPHRLQGRLPGSPGQTAAQRRDLSHRRVGRAKFAKRRRPCSAWSRNIEIEAIAIGNGTAGRETEAFIKRLKLHRSPS